MTAKKRFDEMATLFAKMNRLFDTASKAERYRMILIARRRTTTNCWYAEYQVAQLILNRTLQ